jgi:hypothetical protein
MFGIMLAKAAVTNGINLVVSINNTAIKLDSKISEAEAKFTNYFVVAIGATGLGKGLSDTSSCM